MKKYSALVPLLLLFAWAGCRKQEIPDGIPPLFPFEVVITQEGTPLADAVVIMFSDTVPYMISGRTDAEGKAVMVTQDHSGVPEGEFKVSVSKEVPTPSKFGEFPPDGQAEADGNAELAAVQAVEQWNKDRKNEYRPTHSYVHQKYLLKETTDLIVDTTGIKTITFDVGPAVDDLSFPEDSSRTPR